MTSAAEICLRRAEWQAILFGPNPTRRELLKLQPIWPTRPIRIRVHRNQAFEPVASVLAPYLAFAGFTADIGYSDYDDSLAFATSALAPEAADVEIVWLDFLRYATFGQGEDLGRWLADRLTVLRAQSAAPILIPDSAEDSDAARALNAELRFAVSGLPAVYVCDQQAIHAELGQGYVDERAAFAVGTRLSNAACIRSARYLGSLWIPGALLPRLKAVVLDLDNTLFEGVLGEDGPGGVRLTDGHLALQRRIVELGREGIFLALCSRNELADVRDLFAQRPDFALRPEHLSAMEISWDPKSTALRRIADALHIGTDALLFVDDNPGELAAVASELPEVKPLYAGPHAEDALHALTFYPGLHRWRADEVDALRANDLEATKIRARAAEDASDPNAYLRSLDVRLRFTCDARGELDRLAALSAKTNQFNLSIRRLSPVDVERFMTAPDHSAVSIRLSDRLSDSGIVGAVFTHRCEDTIFIDELCISCRALGRKLEDVMVAGAVRCATAAGGDIRFLRFQPMNGPRNGPALEWLAKLTTEFGPVTSTMDGDGWVTVPWETDAFAQLIAGAPITIESEDSRRAVECQ